MIKRLLASAVFIALATTTSAAAHVTVKPVEVTTASYQTFTVNVPNEKDQATTTVRVDVPEAVTSVTPTVKPGWQINTTKDGERVTAITWSQGTIAQGLRDEFTFSAKTPDTTTEIQWKAYQTYADGTVVSWDKSANEAHGHDSNSGPFSITKVVAQPNTLGATSTKSNNDLALYLAFASLVVAFIGVYISTRPQKK